MDVRKLLGSSGSRTADTVGLPASARNILGNSVPSIAVVEETRLIWTCPRLLLATCRDIVLSTSYALRFSASQSLLEYVPSVPSDEGHLDTFLRPSRRGFVWVLERQDGFLFHRRPPWSSPKSGVCLKSFFPSSFRTRFVGAPGDSCSNLHDGVSSRTTLQQRSSNDLSSLSSLQPATALHYPR